MNRQLSPKYRYLITFLILLMGGVCLAQKKKYEKEVRIEADEVPSSALRMIDALQLEKKVKWYKEFGLQDSSIEAKGKHQGRLHSIEFSDDGSFEDLEIEIKSMDVPAKSSKLIFEQLEKEEGSFKIKKIQIQYSGTAERVVDFFKRGSAEEHLVIHFELVVSRHVNGSYGLYEYLFDEEGSLVSKRKIILNMTENLEY